MGGVQALGPECRCQETDSFNADEVGPATQQMHQQILSTVVAVNVLPDSIIDGSQAPCQSVKSCLHMSIACTVFCSLHQLLPVVASLNAPVFLPACQLSETSSSGISS